MKSNFTRMYMNLRQQALQQVIALPGADTFAYGFLGQAYQRSGRCAEAIPMLRKAIELAPDFEEWKKGLAGCQER